MDRILSPGERGNEKHRPHYRQPAKGVDGSAENTRNRSSRKLNEGGYRHLVSLLVVGQVRVDRELRQERVEDCVSDRIPNSFCIGTSRLRYRSRQCRRREPNWTYYKVLLSRL